MFNLPLGFQLSAKPLNDRMETYMIPWANPEEARKVEKQGLNLKTGRPGDNQSTLTKEGVGASSNSSATTSTYKDPKLKTEAKRPKAAVPAKTNDTATNFLAAYDKILHPIPKGTAPALDVLANMPYPDELDLSDNDPYRPNKELATEFINKYKPQALNTDRTDYSVLMALADGWMKGRTNLAGAYKPPESAYKVVTEAMAMLENSQKNSDNSEIMSRDSETKAKEKLFVEPREAIARMVGNMANLDTKSQTSIVSLAAKLLNDIQQSEARNQTSLDMNVNTNRTKAARDKSDAQLSAERLKQKWYASQSGQKKSEWIKQEREESKLLASKLLGEDITNEKNWKSTERDWIQFTRNLADKLVREQDLVEEFGGDYHAAQMQAYQMLRDNYDPETDSFPYLPIVDGRWRAFRKLNPRK